MNTKPPIQCAFCDHIAPARTIRKDACYSCRAKQKKLEAIHKPTPSAFAWLDLGADQRPNYNDNNRYVPNDVASKHYRHYSI